ncbi:GNAT family N-acetyltransferase [Sutcliffiella cohnii]
MSIQTTLNVKLDFYKEEYRPNLVDYHLSGEQSNYASDPLPALLKCEEDNTRHPVVILYNGEPAGFFILHGWEGVKEYSDNKDAILLRSYSVNPKFQGNGIAKQSLQVLDSFVKRNFPEVNEIILSVNYMNIVAQHVYKMAGFIDKGGRVMGRKGELFILHKTL